MKDRIIYEFKLSRTDVCLLDIVENLLKLSKNYDKYLSSKLMVKDNTIDIRLKIVSDYKSNTIRPVIQFNKMHPSKNKTGANLKDFLSFIQSLLDKDKKTVLESKLLYSNNYAIRSYYIKNDIIYFK